MREFGRKLRWVAAALVLANGVLPALWILASSLETEAALRRTPLGWLLHPPTLANYARAVRVGLLSRDLAGSLAVALLSVACTLLVAVPAAYALARVAPRRRGAVLGAMVAAAAFPLAALLAPLVQGMHGLGLLNTYGAPVLPDTVLTLPACTLVLLGAFESLPPELEGAAQLDGCSRLGAIGRVVLPLAAPSLLAAGLLAFIGAWDELLFAWSLNPGPATRTLTAGVALYGAGAWPMVAAAMTVGLAPVAALAVLAQGWVMSGFATGAMRG